MTLHRAAPAPASPPTAAELRHYLMCPPTHFAVNYRINPWMNPDQPVNVARAQAQWQQLHDQLTQLGHRIDLIPPQPNLPDMVFAANGGIVIGDRALVPRFRHRQRGAESAHFADALAALGFTHVRQARHVNEGEGDFLLIGDQMLAGTGPRSDPQAPAEVAEYFGVTTIRLTLVDPRMYHLDTALAVLDDHTIAYWPGAFDRDSQGLLDELYPDAIKAIENEATLLGLNLISDGRNVITAPGCPVLTSQIAERGLLPLPIATDELHKAGGGAKCCVLTCH